MWRSSHKIQTQNRTYVSFGYNFRKSAELESIKAEYEGRLSDLELRLKESEAQLAAERDALDVERKRNNILQVTTGLVVVLSYFLRRIYLDQN